MRILGIEIAGNYDSAAIKEATAGVETFGRTVNEAATKNIERLAAQRVKLQELAREYQVLAASADKGSAQQVAALDLAARAQKRLGTETVATNAVIRSSARETAASVVLSEREIGKFARGFGTSSGLGKGAALSLGSGGFLLGAGLGVGITATVKAAEGYNVVLRSLDGAIKASGENVDAYSGKIAKLADGGAKLGFTNTDVLGGLKQLTLITGNATDAVTYMGLVEDIARGKGISLETAATAVGKAIDGKTTALQRYGIIVKKGEPIERALTDAQQRWAGQAKDSTTATSKLHAVVGDLEEKIGQALLPEVEHVAAAIGSWISKSKNQKTVTEDVKTAVGDLSTVVRDATKIIRGIDDVTGSFRDTLALLIAIPVGRKFLDWGTDVGVFGTATAGAEAEASGLLGTMGKLKALGPLALVIGLEFIPHSKAKGPISDSGVGKFFSNLPVVGGAFSQANRASDYLNGLLGLNGTTSSKSGGSAGIVGPPSAKAGLSGSALRAAIVADAKRRGVDPTAALAVAAAEGGFSGAIGDGGHAFGPFQINNAGGVATGMPGSFLQGFANTPAGIDFAMKKIAKVAAGKSGYDAIRAIITGFERPADGGAGDLRRATAFLMGGGTPSMATLQFGATSGTKTAKPKAYKIPDTLEAKIRAAQQTFADSVTRGHLDTLDGLLKQEETLLRGHGQQAKAQSIANEITKADDLLAKTLAANVKAQVAAIKSNAAALISTAKAGIASAFGQIITDAQSAFSQETQDYIDNVLSAKYLQGTDSSGMRLQTSSEKKLADMQTADTASQLQDALASAKKQLTDDTTGALLEHVVNITTGATKDIFGPAGTPEQRSLDQKAIDAAQRALDENTIAIDAAKERAQEDYDYAQAVKTYQQQRSLAEAAMTRSLTGLEKGIENGTASMGDLQDVLLKFGVSVSDIPTDQWATDWSNLSTATQTLAQVMLNEAAALAKIGDGKDAAAVAATAASISWQTPITAGQSSVVSGLGGANGYFLLNPIPHAARGADVLSSGLAMIHRGEQVVPAADVTAYSGGGGSITIQVNAPNYVGSHAELAAVLKSPAIVEAVATAVLVGNRRGHIRVNQLT